MGLLRQSDGSSTPLSVDLGEASGHAVASDKDVDMRIVGVHHVNLQVADVTAARAFYSDVLGLAEIDRPAFGVDWLWFQIGGQQLHIGEAKGHTGPDRQHFALQVENLDEVVSAIEQHGVKVRRAGQTLPGAGVQVFLRDPSGNLIELNEPN